MRIATYNVNGITSRLPVLLRWLEQSRPDVVCLQELKAPQEKFPQAAFAMAGYQRNLARSEELERGGDSHARGRVVEIQRGLPGDPQDVHSRYLEASVGGLVVGCLYLPNGNPAPGPKFDYKLRWFERLNVRAAELIASDAPVVLAGDYNVIPTEFDVYKPERWVEDALFRPETRAAYARLLAQGWTDALRKLHPSERLYTYLGLFPQRLCARRGSTHRPSADQPRAERGAQCSGGRSGRYAAGRRAPITRQFGSRCVMRRSKLRGDVDSRVSTPAHAKTLS